MVRARGAECFYGGKVRTRTTRGLHTGVRTDSFLWVRSDVNEALEMTKDPVDGHRSRYRKGARHVKESSSGTRR